MAEVKKEIISSFVQAMEDSGMDLAGICELCKYHIHCGKDCPHYYAGNVKEAGGAFIECWDWACAVPACKTCEHSSNFEWKE